MASRQTLVLRLSSRWSWALVGVVGSGIINPGIVLVNFFTPSRKLPLSHFQLPLNVAGTAYQVQAPS